MKPEAERRPQRPGDRLGPANPPGPVLRFVPGEICVVVSASSLPGGRGSPSVQAAYEEVMQQVNRSVVEGHAPQLGPQADCFERDLAPVSLGSYFQGGPPLLEPLSRKGVDVATPGAERPWIELPAAAGGSASLHFYYQIDKRISRVDELLDQAGSAPDQHRAPCFQLVRDLVNHVNRHAATINQRAQAASWGHAAGMGVSVVAATPNWLTNGSFTCGGPGARPDASPPPGGRWTFNFSPPALQALVEQARQHARPQGWPTGGESPAPRPNGVVVAVLDTCPQPADVGAAARLHGDNLLLREVSRHARLAEPPSIDAGAGHCDHLRWNGVPIVANWRRGLDKQPFDHTSFLMPDHGLFVAGIIHDVAPGAELHLIRVLSDYGVGDLMQLTRILAALPEKFRDCVGEAAERRLIVNLSLMANIPWGELFLDWWLPTTFADAGTLAVRQPDIAAVRSGLEASLADVLMSLREQGILVVAAAGNDALDQPTRPEPRVPAAYDWVFGVAAVDRERQPSGYSNRGDEYVMGNGVAVFGGNAADLPGQVDEPPAVTEPVRGIFSAPTLPISGAPNQTGWALWAGTSFATPVITGLAADVWAQNLGRPGYGPQEVIAGVRDFMTDPASPLDCPVISARQDPAWP